MLINDQSFASKRSQKTEKGLKKQRKVSKTAKSRPIKMQRKISKSRKVSKTEKGFKKQRKVSKIEKVYDRFSKDKSHKLHKTLIQKKDVRINPRLTKAGGGGA